MNINDDHNLDDRVGTTRSTRRELSDYTPEEIETIKQTILKLERFEMCSLRRFASSGHPYFDTTLPFWKVFDKRFNELGGFSPEISKALTL